MPRHFPKLFTTPGRTAWPARADCDDERFRIDGNSGRGWRSLGEARMHG